MPFNYSDAPPPRDFDLIPHGEIATCVLHLRHGGVGEGGVLKRSKAGDCEMLDLEFIVADGLYKGSKFWQYFVVEGTTSGQAQAVDISRGWLKAILDSALGLKPDDKSPQAQAARTVDYKDFDGKTFIAKIGIEKGGPRNDGSGTNYADKNVLLGVITPDKKDWKPVEQPPPFDGGGSGVQAAAPPNTAPPIQRPGWAS